MVKSMFSERMDMKMEWPRQTKTETDCGEQKVEAKEQKREKKRRGVREKGDRTQEKINEKIRLGVGKKEPVRSRGLKGVRVTSRPSPGLFEPLLFIGSPRLIPLSLHRTSPPFRVAKSRKSLVEKTPQPLTSDACTAGKRRNERIQKKMIKMTVKGRWENADVAEAYKEKIMRYQTFAESQ
ncbi:hypothetical protein ALC62_04927 [Cyphomyrmex costatus]|uniref:Uncharacterized protein n=1 Tax=Cyphomyrmex costatus TaxID=456900 RepID=A0A195CUG4_9HYME|nr:hypothetical protein ALC62_04927 [Cyphomyrmex costatus]